MPDETDRLFERFRAGGDPDALGRVFDATAPRLLQLAIHFVGDIAAAEDLVQATFVTAIERAATFDATHSLNAWLSGILANHARALQRAARREIDSASLAQRIESTPLEQALDAEWSAALAQALDRIPEPYRVVLILRLQHGMEPTEIAHALQRSPGAVRVQLHRGREMLRKELPAGILASALFIAEPARGLARVKATVIAQATVAKTSVGIAGVVGVLFMSTKLIFGVIGVAVAFGAWFFMRDGAKRSLAPAAVVAEQVQASPRPNRESTDAVALVDSSSTPQRSEASIVPAANDGKHVKLHGFVYDADSRKGIAGATVELFAPQRMRLSEVRRRWHDRFQVMDDADLHAIGWPRFASELSEAQRFDLEDVMVYAPPVSGVTTPIERAVTNAKGEFEFSAPEALGCIVSSALNYTATIRAVSPAEFNKTNADELTLEVAMNTPKPLSGYVVDEQMKRIERVIRFRFVGLVKRGAYITVGDRKILADDDDRDPQQDQWLVETKPDGNFETSLPATVVHAKELEPDLGIVKQGHLHADGVTWDDDVWPEPGSTPEPLVIVMVPVASIVVRDRATRGPIEDIHVLCTDDRYANPLRIGRFLAPNGRLRLARSNVVALGWRNPVENPEPCECTVWADGYLPTSHHLADLIHGPAIEFELERGESSTITGRIHETDRAVSGARVSLSPAAGGWREGGDYLVAAATTDGDGRFKIPSANGSYRLHVSSGSVEETRRVDVPTSSPIDIDLSIDTRVLVDVRDSAGVPRTLFPIALRGLDGRYVKSTTDAHGLARFSRLTSGAYVVEVNHFLQDVHGDKRPPSRPDQALSIELRTGEEKRVEVVIPASPRFARLVVNGSDSLVGWKARGAANVWTDIESSGRIPIDIRGTPALTITASNAHEWTALLPKDAPDGYLVRIDLVGIGYEGVVKSQENGEPLRGLRIVAKPWDDQAQAKLVTTVVSDENGHFTLTGLADNTYFIRFEDVPRTQLRDGFAIHTTAKPSSPAGSLELVLPTRKTVGHDKLVVSGFEGYAEIPLSGVIRGATKGSQVSGSIASELPHNGYKLLLWTSFHANADGAFHVDVPSSPAFAASLMDATTGEWIGYFEWPASGATDQQTHDIEIP